MSNSIKKIKYCIKKYQNFNEVFFVSFPKSGRTWVRMFLNHYFFNCYPFSITARNRLFYDKKIPNLVFSHGAHDDFGNSSKHDIMKAANNLSEFPKIVLLRDPRDVIISYYFQITKRIPESAIKNNINNLHEIIYDKNLGFNRIIDFMNIWYKSSSNDNTLFLFYENIKKDPETQFISLLKFLGQKDINTVSLKKAILDTSFDKMKEKEKNSFSKSKYLNAANVNDSNSFKSRKGKVGGFYEYLNEHEINELNSIMFDLLPDLKSFYFDK